MKYELTVSRDQVINAAFADLGLYAPGEGPTPAEIEDAALRLNMMIKSWQASDGLGLWLYGNAKLVLERSRYVFTLGPGGDRCSLSMSVTVLSEDADAGATSISVKSADGISVGNNIGIRLDSLSMYWTTVASVSGTNVGLASGLPSRASANGAVFSYLGAAPKPLDIVEARLLSASLDTEIPMNRISYDEFMQFPTKMSVGTPVSYAFIQKVATGNLYVWPSPSDPNYYIDMTVKVPIQAFESGTESPDFPQEWFDALHFGLALRLAPLYMVSGERYKILEAQATRALSEVVGSDREENVSVILVPWFEW